MTKRVLLIDHPASGRSDRASAYLQRHGHSVEWCQPGKGDQLPKPTDSYDAVIVYGGLEMLSTDLDKKETAYLRDEVRFIDGWLATKKPYLGICLGSQLLARTLGSPITPHPEAFHEIGFVEIEPTEAGRGFLPAPMHVYHWHTEGFFEVPKEAELLAKGPVFPNQAIRHGNAFGIQFHPEVAPQTFQGWLDSVPDAVTRKGAQPRAEQVAYAERHDPRMNAWFEDFLPRWLEARL